MFEGRTKYLYDKKIIQNLKLKKHSLYLSIEKGYLTFYMKNKQYFFMQGIQIHITDKNHNKYKVPCC